MHLEGKTNYHNTFEPIFFQIEDSQGKTHSFQPPKSLDRGFLHHFEDFPNIWEIQQYKLTTSDSLDPNEERISFHYLIHPGMNAVIIPPNAIDMPNHLRSRWVSDGIQRFFEIIAAKHGYRLLVWLTPQSVSAFDQRVLKILRWLGYYMWPPTEKSGIYIGEHQSSYTGEWIPEIWTEDEYMLSPTIH
jgi:hypothetical protein